MTAEKDCRMTFHLFDPHLKDYAGHYYEYDQALAAAFAGRGVDTVVYGDRRLKEQALAGLATVPAFDPRIGSKLFYLPVLSIIPNFLVLNPLMFRELWRLGTKRFKREDALFFPSVSQFDIFGLLLWYVLAFRNPRPSLYLLLRIPIETPIPFRRHLKFLQLNYPFFRAAFSLMKTFRSDRIFLLADTEDLSRQYSRLSGREVRVMPIPHLPESPPARKAKGNPAAVFTCLGPDRTEKGFDLLPGAIRSVLEDGLDARFIVQAGSRRPERRVLRAREALRKVSPAQVELIETPLDSERYYRLLGDSDCVLLPYDPSRYFDRSSGIFSEAVAFGKPVITTRGTWMEAVVRRFECGIVMESYDEKALAGAIRSYLADRPRHDRNAALASGAWREEHGAARFVEIILSMHRGAAAPDLRARGGAPAATDGGTK